MYKISKVKHFVSYRYNWKYIKYLKIERFASHGHKVTFEKYIRYLKWKHFESHRYKHVRNSIGCTSRIVLLRCATIRSVHGTLTWNRWEIKLFPEADFVSNGGVRTGAVFKIEPGSVLGACVRWDSGIMDFVSVVLVSGLVRKLETLFYRPKIRNALSKSRKGQASWKYRGEAIRLQRWTSSCSFETKISNYFQIGERNRLFA